MYMCTVTDHHREAEESVKTIYAKEELASGKRELLYSTVYFFGLRAQLHCTVLYIPTMSWLPPLDSINASVYIYAVGQLYHEHRAHTAFRLQ